MVGASITGTFPAGTNNPEIPVGGGSSGRTVPASQMQFDVDRWPLALEDQELQLSFDVPASRLEFGVKDIAP